MRSLQLKVPPPLVVITAAALMAGLTYTFRGASIDIPAHLVLAVVLAAIGIGCIGTGINEFRQHETTIDPRDPQRSSSLVDTGIYRFTRNPMYLGFLVILTGWAVYLGNLLPFVVLPAYVLYLGKYQIEPEERLLAAKFGSRYEAYRRKVRRWI